MILVYDWGRYLFVILGMDSSGYYNPSSCNKQVDFRPGTKCQLLCQGADSVYGGIDTATCGDDGMWTPADGLGYCVPACNALPVPEYAVVTPQSCVEGFVKAGMQAARCSGKINNENIYIM